MSEALRLADALPSIDNLKRIAASDSPTAIQNGLLNAIKWIQALERELNFERAASFRDQAASLEAERDTLRAEVERLQDTITGFCNGQKWAVDAWKNAKHNKPLFDAARAIEAAKEAK